MPLEQHGQVVGQRRQTQRRFRRPERSQAQRRQREALLQFLDHILAVGTPVVVPPHRQAGQLCRRHARDQCLKLIPRHLQQLLAAALVPFVDPMPHQHQPPRLRPAQRLILTFGHLGARHFRRRPHQVAAQQPLNRLAQLRHHHIGHPQPLPQRQQLRQAIRREAACRVAANPASARTPRSRM